jgi:hypothetical protein
MNAEHEDVLETLVIMQEKEAKHQTGRVWLPTWVLDDLPADAINDLVRMGRIEHHFYEPKFRIAD